MAVTSKSALDRIQAIQLEAQEKIDALKREAVSEIARKLAEARSVVRKLEEEYEAVTGKTVRGEKVTSSGRKRLTRAQQEALAEAVKDFLKNNTKGAKMSDLVSATGESTSAIRRILSRLPIKVTGAKATTLYFLK